MSLPRPDATRPVDVLCIGNAIVDVLAQVGDDFLDRHAMVKGSMQLIDPEVGRSIYADMPPAVEVSGGSAANTAAGLASLGRRAVFVGRVADDELGEVFAHDIRAIGVEFVGAIASGVEAGPGTARCLVCVTPDAERTLNTSLGVAGDIRPDDLDLDLLDDAKVVYIEGYLWDEPLAKETIRAAMRTAQAKGVPVAFTLSDGFCVDRHRAEFLELIANHIDILFANTDEICSLFETDDFEVAMTKIAGLCAIAAVTRSEKGSSVVTSHGDRFDVAASFVVPVDTTGAGDLYAAGFLAGWTSGNDLEMCARMGSIAAAEVISHLGARPQADLSALVAELRTLGSDEGE